MRTQVHEGVKIKLSARLRAFVREPSGKDKARLRGLTPRLLDLAVVGFLAGCSSRLQPASLGLINDCEDRWRAHPIVSYHIVVDVDAPGERRRNEITVQQGKISRAVMRYWNRSAGKWEAPTGLGKEQALPFTVPGLFDIIRGEVMRGSRTDIRVEISQHPSYPRCIVLGREVRDGRPLSGTQTTLTVASFGP
jgi:hypothetical protein